MGSKRLYGSVCLYMVIRKGRLSGFLLGPELLELRNLEEAVVDLEGDLLIHRL